MVAMIEKVFNNYTLLIFSDKTKLSQKLSEFIYSDINNLHLKKERYQICVCGGSTPKLVYKFLSERKLEWNKVDVFLGDERCVEPTSKESNSLMLKETLLRNFGNEAYFYNIFSNTEFSEKIVRQNFINQLKKRCKGNPPKFDLTLLGLGDDGHTASLFPNNKNNNNEDLVIYSHGKGLKRISLTPKIISASSKIIFIVSGSSKRAALKRLLDDNESPDRTPAKLIKSKTQILVFCDEEASNDLSI